MNFTRITIVKFLEKLYQCHLKGFKMLKSLNVTLRKTWIIVFLHCSLSLVPPQHPCSSLVPLWLLIIICSLFINQLHLHRWGPAANVVPWPEWLSQDLNPALLTVRQCWWQRDPPATSPPRIRIAGFLFFVENEIKTMPTTLFKWPDANQALAWRSSTQSFPIHELQPDDRAQFHVKHHLPSLLKRACAFLHLDS